MIHTECAEWPSAIVQYPRAVELDPGFAAAWCRIIQARLWLVWVFDDGEAGVQARDDLARLLELAGDDTEVRFSGALYLYYGERRYEEASRELDVVRHRRPADPEVMRFAAFIMERLGRLEEALETMKESLELNPRRAIISGRSTDRLPWQGCATGAAAEIDM